MKLGNKPSAVLAALAVAALVLAAAGVVSVSAGTCASPAQCQREPRGRMPMMGGMGMGRSMARHMYFMRNGVPAAYRGNSSPLAPTTQDIREGATLYADNCATCHGAGGYGDGEGGRGLSPRPANLAHMIRMPMMSDPYLFWTIVEGGEPVGTAMSAFEDVLSKNQIWKIVAAMRAGFPPADRADEQTYSQ